MKKITLAIAMAALVLFAGCKKDKETTGTTIKASIEQCKSGDSKTSIVPVGSEAEIRWTAGDKIVVNNGTTSGTFTLTGGAGSKTGTFTYNGEYTLGDNNIAVYPETATINGTTVTVTLPAEQDFDANKNGANPMLGIFTDPEELTFTSLCGVLGISLTGDNIAITAVEVVSKTDEKLNGEFSCTTTNPQLTVAAGDADTKKVRINYNTTLTSTAQNFYFALPVGALASGFTLNVYGVGADPIFSKATTNAITIALNVVNQMPVVEVTAGPVAWDGDLSKLTDESTEEFATATHGMTITGTLTASSVKVSIADGANVTLQDATINGQGFSSYDYAGLNLLGSANITLVGTSTMSGGVEKAGIYVLENKTLTISGDGTINATGGKYAAGIGSNYRDSSGNIIITDGSGTINATGGYAGAGIGSGYKAAECGNIEITDSFTGTVNATGHYGSPGIGSGNRSSCGSITISGGTINATGEDGGAVGNGAPGIGSGIDGSCGAITINESVTLVTAIKGNSAPCCIGKGSSASCDNITIGGTVYPSGATPNQSDGLTFVYPVPAPVITLETPLTLEALSDGTIVVYDPQSGMQYTLNGGAKQTMSGSVSIDVNTGDKVAFYGNGTSIASYLGTMITGGMADVKVYGNIMSLVDEENFATATTLPANYTFYKLFYHYEHLTDASGLLLPATTLASANSCYAEMFSNCDNLVAGPSELPATTLSPRCYQAMFLYCTSLTVAPILPATTLEGYCYFQMFRLCTSLTEAPVLPAPELTSNCYREMFSGCSSLNSITCLATSAINSSSSTFNWVIGVASGGTFTKASTATWPTGPRGIPEGWTVNDQ